jgi:transcriptional regulator with XRE-family HTH domain
MGGDTMTGAELRAIRRELRWTQPRLARHLSISPGYLAQLEGGAHPITKRTAQAMRVLHLIYLQALEVGLLER